MDEFIINDNTSFTDLTAEIHFSSHWNFNKSVILACYKKFNGNFTKVTKYKVKNILETVKVFEKQFPNWIRPKWTYPKNLL